MGELLHVVGRIMSNNFAMYARQHVASTVAEDEVVAAVTGLQLESRDRVESPDPSEPAETISEPPDTTSEAPDTTSEPSKTTSEPPTNGADLETTAACPAARDTTVGRVVYSSASYFNHSCDPNCLVDRGLHRATVTAQRSIKVCISVLCIFMSFKTVRILKYPVTISAGGGAAHHCLHRPGAATRLPPGHAPAQLFLSLCV